MSPNLWAKFGTFSHTAAVSRGHEPGQKSYLQSGTLRSGFSTPIFSRSNPDSNVFTCSIEFSRYETAHFPKIILCRQESLKNSTTIYFFRQKVLKNIYDISSDDKQLFFRQKQITLEFCSEIQSELLSEKQQVSYRSVQQIFFWDVLLVRQLWIVNYYIK